MNNKVLTIAVIAGIAVVCIAAAAFLLPDRGDEGGIVVNDDTRLMIYGNANNDDYLDQKDVVALERMVEQGSWDSTSAPYADANNDGNVDSADVSYLEGILRKRSTVLYFTNTWGDINSVRYPVTGDVGTMYWEEADLAILLGIWGRVTACGYGSLTEDKNPGYRDRFSYGELGNKVEFETVLESGVSVLIGYGGNDGSTRDIISSSKASGANIDVVSLDLYDAKSRVLMAGVIFGCEDRAHSYVDDCDGIQSYMDGVLDGIDPTDNPTVFICQVDSNHNDTGNIRMYGPTTRSGIYTYLDQTPADIVLPEGSTSHYVNVDIEFVLENNPDYIVFSSSMWSSSLTEEEVRESFLETAERLFGSTRAYEEGNIIATSYGTMNSYLSGYASPMLISQIYDEVDSEYAADVYDSWYDKGFVYYSADEMPQYQFYNLGEIRGDGQ